MILMPEFAELENVRNYLWEMEGPTIDATEGVAISEKRCATITAKVRRDALSAVCDLGDLLRGSGNDLELLRWNDNVRRVVT